MKRALLTLLLLAAPFHAAAQLPECTGVPTLSFVRFDNTAPRQTHRLEWKLEQMPACYGVCTWDWRVEYTPTVAYQWTDYPFTQSHFWSQGVTSSGALATSDPSYLGLYRASVTRTCGVKIAHATSTARWGEAFRR